MTIRVFLVDDHALVRTGMRMILASEVDIEVVGEAETGEAALPEIRRLTPGHRDVDRLHVGLVLARIAEVVGADEDDACRRPGRPCGTVQKEQCQHKETTHDRFLQYVG